jgi:hypothetical protein
MFRLGLAMFRELQVQKEVYKTPKDIVVECVARSIRPYSKIP